MIENLEFEEFYKSLVIGDDNAEVTTEDKFCEGFTGYLTDFGIISDINVLSLDESMGSAKVNCSAWFYDEGEKRLTLFASHYFDSNKVETVSNQDALVDVKRALRVLDLSKKIDLSTLDISDDQHSMLSLIRDSLNEIEKVHVIFLTNGRLKKATDTKEVECGRDIFVGYWDIERLYRLVSSGRVYEPISIDFKEKFGETLNCLSMPSNTNEFQGYLAIIPGSYLAKLYEEYGSRLMELNVRSYLQQRGKVNRGIRETILHQPHRFLAYNNGISVTAEEIVTERTSSGELTIKSITGLQIVNGGQTVASIHRSMKIDKCEHLDSIAVQAKITVVESTLLDELVPQISRFSNTQNTVNEADFASNDPFHINFEKLASKIWVPGEQSRWFYERARGQYDVARIRHAGTSIAKRKVFDSQTPKSQKLAKTDLAKVYQCWEQKPHIVALGSQKNFVNFMGFISMNMSIEQIDESFYKNAIARAIIYKTAESIARKHKFPGYRANTIAYTIALISFKTVGRVDLLPIWENQTIPLALFNTLDTWMPIVWQSIVDTAGSRNVTEWAKKPDCWSSLQLVDVEISSDLEAELRVGDKLPTVGAVARGSKAQQLTTIDRENINRVMQRSADFWWNLSLWGKSSGELERIHIDIITTLAGYARDGWDKIPSHKQAKQAVKAIGLAKQAGYELNCSSSNLA
ncbi:MAG: hypothetical protein ACI88H_001250 [Cocleimonas sp.]|jgi:hypothetical protein